MTDQAPAKPGKHATRTSFKPGYDPRRWLGGRGKKSPEQKDGEKILMAVIWEELSREFDIRSMKPLETEDTVDTLRLMVRSWIKKHPDEIADRIAGKVSQSVEMKGELKVENVYQDSILRKLLTGNDDTPTDNG